MNRLQIRRQGPALLCGLLMLATASVVPTPVLAQSDRDIPRSLMSKLDFLSDEQRTFLQSDQALHVVPSRQKLIEELERREPEQVEQYVADLIRTVEDFAYKPGIDMGEIPLNRESSRFNSFKVKKPEVLKRFRRSPGPFALTRYIRSSTSIPTFAGAPYAITPEDLVMGKVEVAIAGIPQSMSSGSRDGQHGPSTLRAMHGIADRDIYSMVDPGAVLNIVDYGDFAVDRMSLELSIRHVRDMVYETGMTGAVPFLVGGDHSIMYPNVVAIRDLEPDDPVTVVYFGAHYNAEPTVAHALSDRNTMYRLVTEGIVNGENLIQVGLRGPMNDQRAFDWLRNNRVRYHTMAEVEHRGWQEVMERVLDEAKSTSQRVYIAFDVSVLDPAELGAAGRATPGGLMVREITPLLRRLCAETKIAGFEITDFAPMLEFGNTSAMNANYMMNACLSGMAMRKIGITEKDYLNALAVDHGQGK
ncbi:agmatinase family protein [Gilvimarinus sp. F26214L]|uniref:agmatinase family protein n=1 Tax=Gilvimarinus sp. DZF01 TaxID=3461371 RepID=UPI004045DCAB